MKLENLLKGLIGLLTLALLFVVYDSTRDHNTIVGDTAPSFKVLTDSGRTITRTDFGGKLLVLNFWATWCEPCREELPSLNQLQKQIGPGVVVLGVSVDKNEKAYKDFLKRNGVSFETSRDPDSNLPAEYGTFKYPETYVIDATGKVRQKHIGAVDWSDPQVVQSIKALL
jgi:peroxiredoxin